MADCMKYSLGLMLLVLLTHGCTAPPTKSNSPASHRVIVSTDIGGTDFDDFQSLVHLLLYSDTIDLEGIISSPYGKGRKEHILEVIDAYAVDFPKLKIASDGYPSPDSLRQMVKQGAIDIPDASGHGEPTEGSNWIVECARKKDSRPLYILVWGGLEDLAQALHDAPDILPKLRVYFIGGPNKKWSVNAYQYIAETHPTLWMIEANTTYRGWFVGGEQSGQWENSAFVERYIQGTGALGAYFYAKGERMKMGDSPSLTYLLNGDPENPAGPSWGGQFVRASDRPHKVWHRITTEQDSIEQFGVLELRLPFSTDTIGTPFALMEVDRPIFGHVYNDTIRFLFSPKNPSVYSYRISSNIPSIDGSKGQITSFSPPAIMKSSPSDRFPNWWTDAPSPEYMEEGYIGIKTVNRWKVAFLQDFADRIKRCEN